MATFARSLPEARGGCLQSVLWERVGLLAVKLTKSVQASEAGPSLAEPPAMNSWQCRFSDPGTLPGEVSLCMGSDSLCPPVCLSNFWGRDLPRDLSCLMDLRTVTGFQFV